MVILTPHPRRALIISLKVPFYKHRSWGRTLGGEYQILYFNCAFLSFFPNPYEHLGVPKGHGEPI